MAFGANFNVQSRQTGPQLASSADLNSLNLPNAAIEQTLQAGFGAALGGIGGGDSSASFNASAGFGGAVGGAAAYGGVTMGQQLGGFADAFQGTNMNQFQQSMGMGMGMQGGAGQFGAMGAYGAMPNPAAQMAYQSRYGGAQFQASGMTSFRGGAGGGAQFNVQQKANLPVPQWLGKDTVTAFQAGNKGNEVTLMTQDANRNIAARVQELMAAGASPEQIRLVVNQMRLNQVQESLALVTGLNSSFHEMSKSIIQNIKA